MTLEEIYARCKEDADCLIWQGANNSNGHPKFRDQTVRRAVWRLERGEIPAGMMVSTTCGHSLCLHPEHLTLTTKSEVSLKVAQRHDYILRKSAANARTARTVLGKITMDIAREIRSTDKTGKEWAKDLGVSTSLVSLVRRNKSWREYSSPFAGLMR